MHHGQGFNAGPTQSSAGMGVKRGEVGRETWDMGVQVFKINFRPSHSKTRRTPESDLPLASAVSLRTQLFFHAVPSIFASLTKAGSGLWWLQNPQLKLVARNIYSEMKGP